MCLTDTGMEAPPHPKARGQQGQAPGTRTVSPSESGTGPGDPLGRQGLRVVPRGDMWGGVSVGAGRYGLFSGFGDI